MNKNFEDGILTVKLTGRVDSGNAAEVEKELLDEIAACKPESVLLDAEELEYISSAGLRVVLKVKKTVDSTHIINASTEVYDIFDMTGFTDILDVRKALRQISVEGCEVIGKGTHGTVYRISSDEILKLYREDEPLADIKREISYAKKAFVYGIPTAISYDVVKSGDAYGIVFELINADTLSNRIVGEPEQFPEYQQKYIELVQKIHAIEADKSIFSSVKELYHHWIDELEGFYEKDELELLHQIISSVPDRDTFVHGDIHPKNIMVQNGELLFIDMADLTYGHPVFDYAGIALTHIIAGEQNPAAVKWLIGIEAEQAETLWDKLMKDIFKDRTKKEQKQIEDVIRGFALLKYAISPAINKAQGEQLNAGIKEKTRKEFFPNAGKLIGAVEF